MRQCEKFMVNTGIMMLAYAYALEGYQTASIFAGIGGFIMALYCHSIGTLERRIFSIDVLSILGLLVIRLFHLEGSYPWLGFVFLLNAAVSCMWMESSFKAVRKTMHWLCMVLCACVIAMLVLPAYFDQSGAGIQLSALFFLPYVIGWSLKCMRRHNPSNSLFKQRIMNRNYAEVMTDDRMAGKAVHTGS